MSSSAASSDLIVSSSLSPVAPSFSPSTQSSLSPSSTLFSTFSDPMSSSFPDIPATTTSSLPSTSSTSESSTMPTTTSSTSSTTTSPTSTSSSTTSTTSTTTTSTSETPDPTTTTTSSSSTTVEPTTTTTFEPPETTTLEPPETTILILPTSSPTPDPTRIPNAPTTTFSSIVFITTTDHLGSPTRTAPSVITSTLTSTNANGGIITVTQVIANPSLLPNNPRSKGNGFFGNTGAVAAVFILVGLAATSIALWIFFAIRRRHRQLRAELSTAVAASQAATAHRSPLDDDDDPHGPSFSASALEMSQRRSSSGLGSAFPGPSFHDDPDRIDIGFNPYADFGYPGPGRAAPNGSRDGYIMTRTSSPPAYTNAQQDSSRRQSMSTSMSNTSAPEGYIMGTHSTTPSRASYEPLMASYYRQTSGRDSPVLATPTVVAPAAAKAPSDKSTQPLIDDREPTETHSALTSETMDDRLDPGLRRRQKEADSASMKDLKDEEDYSRPVLGVRNLP